MYLVVLCELLSRLPPGIASLSHKSKVNNCSILKPSEILRNLKDIMNNNHAEESIYLSYIY